LASDHQYRLKFLPSHNFIEGTNTIETAKLGHLKRVGLFFDRAFEDYIPKNASCGHGQDEGVS
jgi:hypothetical protein